MTEPGPAAESLQQLHMAFGWNPMVTAAVILVAVYACIVTERINRAIAALLGAGALVILGVLNQELAVRGIDFNTIFLLAGMMLIVAISRESGIFQFVAIMAARAVRGSPRLLLVVLAFVTAIFSAFLDNVTTVLLVVPVTLFLTDQLKVDSYPFLFSQIFASNIGGTATLIGDPPNIMIGSAVGFSFMDFLANLGPVCLVVLIVMTILFDVIWGRKMVAAEEDRDNLMRFDPYEAITDSPLLWKSLFVLGLVMTGFVCGHDMGWAPGTVALTGAALLLLLQNAVYGPALQSKGVQKAFHHVEWETIFFFIGLFVIVYGVEYTGLLNLLAGKMLALTGTSVPVAGFVILGVSAILSAVIDNIPFVATMIPMIKAVTPDFGGAAAVEPLWWCLALGACLGGNGTLIGASANVMVAGFAERAGARISFMKFLRLAFPLMLLSVTIAAAYVWLLYFRT